MPVVWLIGDTDAAAPAGLTDALTRLGADVRAPIPLAAAVAQLTGATEPAGPVVLLDARTTGHEHPLRMLLADDRADIGMLTDTLAETKPAPVLGVRLSPRARPVLARVAGTGVTSLSDLECRVRTFAGLPADFTVRAVGPGALVASVASPTDGQSIRAARDAVEAAGGEDRMRMDQSVKRLDNPVAAHLIAPWSKRLARLLVRLKVAPDAVTVASLVVALGSAVAAATGARVGYVVAAVTMLASFALDCTDGQMARYAVRYSALGAWLDGFGDRVKEQLVLAGLAVGGAQAALTSGAGARTAAGLWLLAAAAGAVTLIRHLVGFGYTAAHRLPGTPPVPAGELTRSQRLRFDLRKTAMLPFGERTLLTAVLVAATSPRVVFVVLALAGAAATLAMLAGRVRRTIGAAAVRAARAGRVFEPAGLAAVAVLADAGAVAAAGARWLRRRARTLLAVPGSLLLAGGPTAGLLAAALATGGSLLPGLLALLAAGWWTLTGAVCAARPAGPLAWSLPAATGFVEAAVVLVSAHTLLGLRAGVGPLAPLAVAGSAFVLLALVSMHRYGREYAGSLAGTSRSMRGPALLALGHELRMLLVAALTLAASLTGVGWLARLALWLPAAFVLAGLLLAQAGEVQATLRLQRARR